MVTYQNYTNQAYGLQLLLYRKNSLLQNWKLSKKSQTKQLPDSTLERSSMSLISCSTRSPEESITSSSWCCSLSSFVFARISVMLTTPARGDLISWDIVANICLARIVSSVKRAKEINSRWEKTGLQVYQRNDFSQSIQNYWTCYVNCFI